MKKISRFFRWLLGYWFCLCDFDCKYSLNCKYFGSPLCGHCDQCIMDMCGHCTNRDKCEFSRRQKFARDDNWR